MRQGPVEENHHSCRHRALLKEQPRPRPAPWWPPYWTAALLVISNWAAPRCAGPGEAESTFLPACSCSRGSWERAQAPHRRPGPARPPRTKPPPAPPGAARRGAALTSSGTRTATRRRRHPSSRSQPSCVCPIQRARAGWETGGPPPPGAIPGCIVRHVRARARLGGGGSAHARAPREGAGEVCHVTSRRVTPVARGGFEEAARSEAGAEGGREVVGAVREGRAAQHVGERDAPPLPATAVPKTTCRLGP